MKTTLAFSLLALSPLHALPVFIGTGGKGNAIYRAEFNIETGELSKPELAVEYRDANFLALHPEKPILYTVGKPNDASVPNGSVAAFSIDDQGLNFLGEAASGGNGPCHLAIDATGNYVAIAHYGDGAVSTVKLNEQGIPAGEPEVERNEGSGPHSRQDAPHAHGVYFNAKNDRLFVPDLGIDRILHYRFDAETGELTADTHGITAPGSGPRHMAFHPTGRYAYVINELDNTVGVFAYDDVAGSFTAIETQPTLPADFDAPNKTSEIEVHPNGKFLYASNRGHESIAIWEIDPETGKLTFIDRAPSGGEHPRHFKIDPTGRFLISANQDTGEIVTLAIDAESGKLTPTGHQTTAPGPVCILFYDR